MHLVGCFKIDQHQNIDWIEITLFHFKIKETYYHTYLSDSSDPSENTNIILCNEMHAPNDDTICPLALQSNQ